MILNNDKLIMLGEKIQPIRKENTFMVDLILPNLLLIAKLSKVTTMTIMNEKAQDGRKDWNKIFKSGRWAENLVTFSNHSSI